MRVKRLRPMRGAGAAGSARAIVRAVAAAAVAVGVLFSSTSVVEAAAPAPPPSALPALSASALPARYAENSAYAIRALHRAEHSGNREQVGPLRQLARPGRQLLTLDARGRGRIVEAFGDLAHARRIALFVPGADTRLDTYGSAGSSHPWTHAEGGARDLYRALHAKDPHTAVIAWLGYDTPDLISSDVLTDDDALRAAPALRGFVHRLRTGFPSARLDLLCHSYGSVVCGKAVHGLDIDNLAVFGSPGTGADTAAGLHTRARVWAARSSGDWIGDVPHTSLAVLGTTVGFGTDPVQPGFGARVFPGGKGEHGDYLKPGDPALHGLVHIVTDG